MPQDTQETDWIEWQGGECPVDPGTFVKVRFACDHSDAAALAYPARPARWWLHAWRRKRVANRITGYIVVSSL